MYVHTRVHVSRIGRKTLNAKCRRTHEHVQHEKERALRFTGHACVARSRFVQEKQTIASHKGSKIKAWKEKAVEKKREKQEKRERERGGRERRRHLTL